MASESSQPAVSQITQAANHVAKATAQLVAGSTESSTSKLGSAQPIALLSVYDKTGLLELAQGLSDSGVRLLGSGGTAKKIRDAGIPIEYDILRRDRCLTVHDILSETSLISQRHPKCLGDVSKHFTPLYMEVSRSIID